MDRLPVSNDLSKAARRKSTTSGNPEPGGQTLPVFLRSLAYSRRQFGIERQGETFGGHDTDNTKLLVYINMIF